MLISKVFFIFASMKIELQCKTKGDGQITVFDRPVLIDSKIFTIELFKSIGDPSIEFICDQIAEAGYSTLDAINPQELEEINIKITL